MATKVRFIIPNGFAIPNYIHLYRNATSTYYITVISSWHLRASLVP